MILLSSHFCTFSCSRSGFNAIQYEICNQKFRDIIRISTKKLVFHYLGYFNISVITGYGVSKVVISNHPNFKEDDLLMGYIGWEEYNIIPGAKSLQKIEDTDLPISYYLGVLGNCRIDNLYLSNHFCLRICSKNIISILWSLLILSLRLFTYF